MLEKLEVLEKISMDEIDTMYDEIVKDMDYFDIPHFMIAAQKYLIDKKIKEEIIYNMLLEKAKRDLYMLDINALLESAINSIFNPEVAQMTMDDLKEDFASLDTDKLKDLLQIFVNTH